MWDDAKQARLDALREKEEQDTLDAAEERDLASLYAELDAEEAECLRPAMERMDREAAEMRERNQRLAALVARRRALLAQMRSQIAEWLGEHERLEAEARPLVAAGRLL